MQKKLIDLEKDRNVKNFRLQLEEYKYNSYMTHNFHPYPAKFIPQIPKEIMLSITKKDDWILDPFCGSGTTLVEAKLNSRNAIGIDINPLSCLVSRAKTQILDSSQIDMVKEVLEDVRSDFQNNMRYEAPNYQNIDHWFQKGVKRELSLILHHIKSVEDEKVQDFLSAGFSAILVKVSNQDSDTRYTAVEKDIKKEEVWYKFKNKIKDMLRRLQDFSEASSNSIINVHNKDSRDMGFLNRKIDAVITSPPYPNSYDYYLYHKHRMLWLGLDYRNAQEKEFGSRHKHSDKDKGLDHYEDAMRKVVQSVSEVLKEKGYFAMIIGDAILKGDLIKMNNVIDDIFISEGYNKVREISFDQRKYTRTFTPNMKTKHKESYVLVYQT